MTHRENDKIKENVRNTHTFRFIVERWRAVTTIISSNFPMVYKLSSHVDTTSKTCAEVMDFSTGYIFFASIGRVNVGSFLIQRRRKKPKSVRSGVLSFVTPSLMHSEFR